MTLSRAYVLSLIVHGVLALVLLNTDLRTRAQSAENALRARAAEHAEVYRKNTAEGQAGQMKRIRELVEKLAAREREQDQAESAGNPLLKSPDKAPPPQPSPAAARQPVEKAAQTNEELWKKGRDEYVATRERYLELRARRLARLNKIDLETARQQVARSATRDAAGARPPANEQEAAKQLEAMHADAQNMLNQTLSDQRSRTEGLPLNGDDRRDAYRLSETQETARESQSFDESVDFTGLMRDSRGDSAANAILDDGGDALRRVDRTQFFALRRQLRDQALDIAFTRRMGEPGSKRAAWVCPDSWYIIGPFPNPDRTMIDHTFPPELEIDRDAVYEGKDGRPVAWQYTKPLRHIVVPPDVSEYAIYYGFTEIHCAEAMDCWLALGSDDHSKLWINDLLVWSSSKNLKTRNTGEGFRRVHFAQGVNRLLFRLENGWNGAEFSLLIRLE
jgi:hypothetical protein